MTGRLGPAIRPLLVACALLGSVASRQALADWHSLSGLLPEHASNLEYVISPDSKTVAFVTDRDTDRIEELYAVPIAGGAEPIKLNPTLVEDGDVDGARVAFTPDGSHVLYVADQEVDNRRELYRVPVGGGPAVKLNPPLVVGGNVTSFVVDADSGFVVYVADQEANDVFELWSVPIAGGPSTRLNGPFVAGGDVGIFRIDPLSDRVVYSADQETDGKFELFSARIGGGGVTKLNPPIVLVGGGDSGLYSDWAVNPTVPVVVFVARETGSTNGKVYMNFTAGGTPMQLGFNLLTTQRLRSVFVSPLGDRVVYKVATREAANPGFSSLGNLHSSLIGGGGNVDLTAPPAAANFGADLYQISPDGARVVYEFQQDASSTPRIESSVLSTGVRAMLYAPSASAPQPAGFLISPDSQWVAYRTEDQDLYTVPIAGGSPVRHAGSFPVFLPDGSRILFTRSGQSSSELFSAQVFGGGERNLSGLEGTGFASRATPTRDGAWIVFPVQIDGRYDLRASDGEKAQPLPASSTTLPGTPTTSSTTTTLPPSAPEVCGNCLDDDGDGRIDLDDESCCGATAALTVTRGKLSGTKGGGTKLAVKATLADASIVPTDRPFPDMLVQLGPAAGAPLLCARLPSGSLGFRKGTFQFQDAQGLVAGANGVRLLKLGRNKKGGGSLVLRAEEPFALPQAGPLRLTVGASVARGAAICRTATSDYRSTRKGLRTE